MAQLKDSEKEALTERHAALDALISDVESRLGDPSTSIPKRIALFVEPSPFTCVLALHFFAFYFDFNAQIFSTHLRKRRILA